MSRLQDAAAAAAPLPTPAEEARVGLLLFAAGLALLPIATLLARRIFPGRNVFFARWGFSHAALVLLAGFLALSLALSGAQLFAPPGEGEIPPGALSTLSSGGQAVPWVLVEFGAQVLAYCLIAFLIVGIARRVSPEGAAALGLRASRTPSALAVGAVSYVLAAPALVGLALAWPWILTLLGQAPAPQAVAVEIGALADRGGPWFAVAGLLAILVVPFFEELTFRGFLQPLLVQNFGDRGGVALTSFFFALLHGADAFLPIFGLSLVLGGVMLRTQRLAAPWAVHALNNAIMLALLSQPEGRSVLLGGLA